MSVVDIEATHSSVIHPRDFIKKELTVFDIFNEKLAIWISRNIGSMWCAYLFAVIGGTAIVGALTGSVFIVLLIGSISGYFLQLVLLPIIMVAQNVAQKATDAKADADYTAITHIANVVDQINSKIK